MTPVTLREAAALIESLTADRDALAEQVRLMREALEEVKCYIGMWRHEHETAYGRMDESDALEVCNDIKKVELALLSPPTESAKLIESLTADRDALAETARVMREALEWSNVHVEYVADLDAHSDNPTGEATVALRLMEVALALTPTAAEEQAKANAEKAALLDWLDHTRPSLSFGCSPEYPLGAWGIFWTNKQTKQVEEAEAERLPDALRAAREASYE